MTIQGLNSIRVSGLVEQVRAELRAAILSGRIRPGAAMQDSVVAADLQVSRAPVREAMRLLEESGLLVKVPNRPYQVTQFSAEDYVDLASLRTALEELATRLAVGRDLDLAEPRRALDRMRVAAGSEAGALELISADRAFHEALVNVAGNAQLNAAYSRVRDQIELAMLTRIDADRQPLEGIHERHVGLFELYLDAVATGDPRSYFPVLEEHIAAGIGVPTPAPWPAVDAQPAPRSGDSET